MTINNPTPKKQSLIIKILKVVIAIVFEIVFVVTLGLILGYFYKKYFP